MAFQNIIGKQLGQRPIPMTYSTLYVTPDATRAYIKDIDICNTTSSSITVYVSLVIVGGTPSADNAILYNATVPPYSTLQWAGTQILNPGSTVQVKASAMGCTVTMSGGEAT